ncbi:maleylacetate reductase [Achromobacter animicus]|uniref:maleylacetate reductase n=1 Tax=Achromobacter animicus TaxID=1389935 RepID=UPI0028A59FF3|nr:maleylacetate reductase [Achromobacter animicus]
MRPFVYTASATRVIFGPGVIERLPEEMDRLGFKRILVVAAPSAVSQLRSTILGLEDRVVGVFDRPVPHVPISVAEEARQLAQTLGADSCLAIGGGSSIGLGKAIALTSGLPLAAVPTTYAGSEMTSVYGITDGGLKHTGRDPRVQPRTVLYDPMLTVSLSPALSASSGMNSIAHCVEALYAQDGNPVVSLIAEEGIRAFASALPRVVTSPDDENARTLALYGAWLAGSALGSTTMALHHKVCHVLGGSFNLPHALMHSIVLPHATKYNRDAAPEAMTRIARALDCGDAPTGLYMLAERLRLPLSLASIGMPESGLEAAARQITSAPYPNPAALTFSDVFALLRAAFVGEAPTLDA